jgi:hypothetical protein
LLRNASAAFHPAKQRPPQVMVDKIYKVWKEGHQDELLGWYGTYMMFKTWAVGAAVEMRLAA